MHRIILFIVGISLFWNEAFAAGLPFSDVKSTDTFSEGVRSLYDYGIISDDGTHLFRPYDPINRDMFVGLATSVSCQKCLTPSIDDILHFGSSPFIDLSTANPYYYCITHANEDDIVQGYSLSSVGSATCENGKSYSNPPFCEGNRTTRIEAAAMLLRQSNLWNDMKNVGYTKKIEIADVSPYWQGYAEKGIQAGILTLSSLHRVRPDESITRGEFAEMSATMLSFNQCSLTPSMQNTMAGAIGVIDASGKAIEKSRFIPGDGSIFIPITSLGTWKYSWKATNRKTGEIRTFLSDTLPTENISDGTWIIELSFIDPITKAIVSQPKSTIVIDGTGAGATGTPTVNSNPLQISLSADPHIGGKGIPFHFSSDVSGASSGLTYFWEFGDGKSSNTRENEDHTYEIPGIYTARLTVKDVSGGMSTSETLINVTSGTSTASILSQNALSVLIEAKPLSNHVGEKINFNALVSGGDKNTLIYSWDYGDGSRSDSAGVSSHIYDTPGIYTVILTLRDGIGNISHSEIIVSISGVIDSDSDGVDDSMDTCILIRGSSENAGCPVITTLDLNGILGRKFSGNIGLSGRDRDGDGVDDTNDLCPDVRGSIANNGCPTLSLLSGISENQCLSDQLMTRGLIIASPVCLTCPCENTISLMSLARTCDILFPAILSKDRTSIYSRGGFYQIH